MGITQEAFDSLCHVWTRNHAIQAVREIESEVNEGRIGKITIYIQNKYVNNLPEIVNLTCAMCHVIGWTGTRGEYTSVDNYGYTSYRVDFFNLKPYRKPLTAGNIAILTKYGINSDFETVNTLLYPPKPKDTNCNQDCIPNPPRKTETPKKTLIEKIKGIFS